MMRKNECLKIVYAIEPKSIYAQNLSVDWMRVRVRVSVFAVCEQHGTMNLFWCRCDCVKFEHPPENFVAWLNSLNLTPTKWIPSTLNIRYLFRLLYTLWH